MTKTRKTLLTTLCLAAFGPAAWGQTPPVSIIEATVQDFTTYVVDTLDPARLATIPTVTTPALRNNFAMTYHIGDIVAINGKPARGTITMQQVNVLLRPSPAPGQAIADGFRNVMATETLDFFHEDGRPIGAIMLSGLGGGDAPPGAALGAAANAGQNFTITGGTGAFFGMRGLKTVVGGSAAGTPRTTSVTEDPSQRRALGARYTFRVKFPLIPMFWPKVTSVMHSDSTEVTAANPARSGEVLNLRATGLGPLRSPSVDPGAPFPDPPLEVNSPVEVTVNGQPAAVINQVGWPGTTDSYLVQVRIPDGLAAGTAKVVLTAAWVLGEEASFPVR